MSCSKPSNSKDWLGKDFYRLSEFLVMLSEFDVGVGVAFFGSETKATMSIISQLTRKESQKNNW